MEEKPSEASTDTTSIPAVAAAPASPATPGQARALGWCAAAALAVIIWLVVPVGVGILIGALMGFSLQPLYERFEKRTNKPRLSALILVVLTGIAIATVAGIFAYLFITKGVVLAESLVKSFGPGGRAASYVEELSDEAARFGVEPGEVTEKLRAATSSIAASVGTIATRIAEATASAVIGLLFAMLTMHQIFRNWDTLTTQVVDAFPLKPAYTRALIEEFRRVGRTTFLGTVLTGLAQGALAAVGYAITGVPEPVFFGAATAVFSIIPVVGTMLVWLPAGLVLVVSGHPARGIIEMIWGAVITGGVSEYIIRPRLVGRKSTIPALMMFVALLGGVHVFGLEGLFIGPIAISLALAVLRLYAAEAHDRRDGRDGPPST